MAMPETWGDYPLFLSILRVGKMSGFHHATVIFSGVLLFSNPFSRTATNLSKGLVMGFTRAVFTESLPPHLRCPERTKG